MIMFSRLRHRYSARLIRVAAVFAAAVLSALTLPSGVASAHNPDISVPQTESPNSNPITLAQHICHVIGTPDQFGNEAVHCADLFSQFDAQFGGTVFWAQNEVLCQNSAGTTVQCAEIVEDVQMANLAQATNKLTVIQDPGICGVRVGHSACSSGRVENVAFIGVPAKGYIWAVSGPDMVVLPRSGKSVNGPNVETKHFFVIGAG